MSGINLDALELEDDMGVDRASMPTLELETPAVIHAQIEPIIAPLAELLPADFPLPTLIRFCPSAELKSELDKSIEYASKLDVANKGTDGLQAADLALSNLNAVLKRVVDHFAEPADIANRLHKSITSTRADWCQPADRAKQILGGAMYTEQKRLEDIAKEEQRKQQAEADRIAKEDAAKRLEEAQKNAAPPAVVQQLKEDVQTAVAPPVPAQVRPADVMKSTSTVTTWKARIKGTAGDADPNPAIEQLTKDQWAAVAQLMLDVAEGKAPRACFSINWSYLNDRAKSDKGTLAITGIEAFSEGSVRAKGRRR